MYKILSPTDSQENCLSTYDTNFHLTLIVLLCDLVKFKNLQ